MLQQQHPNRDHFVVINPLNSRTVRKSHCATPQVNSKQGLKRPNTPRTAATREISAVEDRWGGRIAAGGGAI
jgi:hypothetical protein